MLHLGGDCALTERKRDACLHLLVRARNTPACLPLAGVLFHARSELSLALPAREFTRKKVRAKRLPKLALRPFLQTLANYLGLPPPPLA
jgi:hypothetical protein